MSAILTLARARVELGERVQAVDLYREAFVESGIGKVAEATTLWEATSDPGSYLVIVRYSDEGAADRGVEEASLADAIAELIKLADTTPDVRRYRLAGASKMRECDVEIGSCLSMSIRQADPGHGWDLDAELSRILEEIALLPGFLGSMHGRSATVHEEVMSIALWKDEASFRASVPKHHLFALSSFARVA